MKRPFCSLILLFICSYCTSLASFAATVTYTPASATENGAIYGSLPISKIGSIGLNSGIARIEGYTIDVTQKFKGTESNAAFGIVINAAVVGGGGHATLKGICYFSNGTLLSEFSNPGYTETVDLTDGSTVAGKLRSVGVGEVTIDTPSGAKHIASSEIARLHSPAAFDLEVHVLSKNNIRAYQKFEAEVLKTTLNSTTEKNTKAKH